MKRSEANKKKNFFNKGATFPQFILLEIGLLSFLLAVAAGFFSVVSTLK